MRTAQIAKLAFRQSRTDLRSTEWRALLAALLLATTRASFLALLGNQLEKGLGNQSAAMLGADLTLSDSRPVPETILQQAIKKNIETTRVIQFSTMISTEQQMLLSSVRAVSAPYPLRGSLITKPAQSASVPAPGTAWAEPQLLERLGITPGTMISLGYTELKITATLLQSPDRGTGFRSFSPQLLMNQQDLQAARVIQPGSRVGYRMLFRGETQAIKQLQAELEQSLTPQQRIWSVHSDQPMAEGAMEHASGFLRLAALFGLLLCGLLITLSLRRYSSAQFRRCALLKCLGLQPGQLLWLYLLKLCSGWLIAASGGLLISLGLLELVAFLLQGLLPAGLPLADPLIYLAGPALSLALLLIIGFSPLMQMSDVPVMGLLRHDQLSEQSLSNPARVMVALLLMAVLAIYLGSLISAFLAMLIIGLFTLIAGFLTSLLLAPSAKALAQRFTLGRLLLYRLRQQRQWHRIQLGIMSLLLALLSSLLLSQSELVSRWQQQLPEDTPNQFIINIQPWELEPLSSFLTVSGVNHKLYPMIRGRITGLNNQPPEATLNQEQLEHNALNRELNLSWSDTAPDHNQLIAGEWWPSGSQAALISIEQELAETLGLTLGSQLSFEIGGETFSATISNIRKVEWRSFRPNFYIIFSPGVLKNYPQTYITSFKLPDTAGFSRELLQQFPALTLIDVKQWIDQAEQLIDQLIQAATLVLGLTLTAGILLVQLLLHQELEQRRKENALLQVLGSTQRQTRQLDLLEFSLLGGLAGTMAALLSELITGLISERVLELPFVLHPWLWVLLPITGALLFALGTLSAHRSSGYRQLQQI